MTYRERTEQFQRAMIAEVVARVGWLGAARELKVAPSTLHRIRRRIGITACSPFRRGVSAYNRERG